MIRQMLIFSNVHTFKNNWFYPQSIVLMLIQIPEVYWSIPLVQYWSKKMNGSSNMLWENVMLNCYPSTLILVAKVLQGKILSFNYRWRIYYQNLNFFIIFQIKLSRITIPSDNEIHSSIISTCQQYWWFFRG